MNAGGRLLRRLRRRPAAQDPQRAEQALEQQRAEEAMRAQVRRRQTGQNSAGPFDNGAGPF